MKNRIEELFHEVADLSPEARALYFEEHQIDPAIRLEVEALAAFDSGSSALLERDIGMVVQGGMPGSELSDLRCGPYRLGGLLGRGGMGAVYWAVRVDGEVAHRVAVKLLRPGADYPALRQRFLAERQILATLSHPNIARLLDAGHREDGQPYLVMEYVEGKALNDYASGLSTPQKIALFLKVCAAVGHLHKNLIVHRDLKPANILVTADGEPKLLDFGLAKLLDLTADSTANSILIITPDYASPEQVAGCPVSTAMDVYSLGAVLYQLLTGSSPHQFASGSPEAIALAISTGRIEPPSRLAPSLKGDLELIVMKALRREPQERYGTIEQFSEDLERYLESRPIRARTGDSWYRTRKFLRRYWLPVTAAGLAVAGLVGGALLANRQRAIAQVRFGEVRQLANVFLFDFERSIRDVPGTLDARSLVASTGQRYLKQLAADSGFDPALQREIAAGYQRLAAVEDAIQTGGGKSPGATDSMLQSVAILRSLGDDRSHDATLRRKYLELVSDLGYKYQDTHNTKEAARWADEAMNLSEKWVAAEPRSKDALAAATAAFTRGATTQEVSGQTARALQTLDKSTAFGERAIAAAPGDDAVGVLVADSERIYSEMLETVGRYSEARLHGERALRLIEPQWARRPGDPRLRLKFMAASSAVGISEHHLGESDPAHLELALPYLRQSFTLAEENMRADARHVRDKGSFVLYCSRYCSLLVTMKRFGDAEALYKRAAAVTRELVGLDPRNRRSWYLLGKVQLDLGWTYLRSGDFARAREALMAADEGLLHGLEMDPADTVILECRAGQFEGLARAALASGHMTDAGRRMQQCLDVIRGMVRRDPSVKSYIGDYAEKLKLAREIGVPASDL